MRFASVCSGIEAASLAWEPLGWQAVWLSQYDPTHNYRNGPDFPSAVLAYRWPHVPNHGDMTKLASAVRAGRIEAPPVVVGGTPCQAFSIAGLRAGLADARGQLTLSYVDLADAIDDERRQNGEAPAVFVWENVPGVLSSKDNAFGCFLAGLAGEDEALKPSGKKWTNAGVVSGPKRTIAWRILDAQYFGVAQRRRRVFVIASANKNIDPAKILFEFDSVRRDFAPSREAGATVAALTADGVGTVGADDNQAQAGHLIMATGQPGAEIGKDVAPTLSCNHEAPIAFSSNGFASFTEGVGPLRAKDGSDHENIAISFNWQAAGNTSATLGANDHVTGALQASQHPAVCVTGDITHTLKGEGFDGSEDGTGRGYPIIAFAENSRGEVRLQNGDGQIFGTLSTGGGKPGQGQPAIAYAIAGNTIGRHPHNGGNGTGYSAETAYTLTKTDQHAVADGMAVRRLMPVECERLQAIPDNHTLIPWRNKPPADCPDGPRYRATGNSMAVVVMRWIGERIAAAIAPKYPDYEDFSK
ncbi:DNA cytosine methyltransferase [Serratia fonticola]|uniref:DNA cytosine methyltransferase n=1 Tax=Serratia fonticola TaxID=47917 RepID=UPI0034C5E236